MADNRYYVLDGREIKPVDDVRVWGEFFNDDEARRVGLDEVGEMKVSTVFLGLNHNWGEGPPLLFETMVFGIPSSEPMWRYATYEAAEAGHRRVVEALTDGEDLMQLDIED